MTRIKKGWIMALAILLALGLTACGFRDQKRTEMLIGTWTARVDHSTEEAQRLLTFVDFFEEEIALCDLTQLDFVTSIRFDTDGSYTMDVDVAGTQACVREFYAVCMESLYEGREALHDVYNEDFSDMSIDEFNLFFAGLYGYSDYEQLLNDFAANAYDYGSMREVETGVFEVKGDEIYFVENGSSVTEYAAYRNEDGVLTIEFDNTACSYTKAA